MNDEMNDMERNREQHAAGRHRARLMPVFILALLAMAGCSQNELTDEQPDGDNAPGKKITITASMPEPGATTRLTFDDQTDGQGNGKLVVKWNQSNEKIYLCNGTTREGAYASSTYTQVAGSWGEDGKKTDFIGDLPKGTEVGDVLYAYYNSSITDDQNFHIVNPQGLVVSGIRSDGSLAGMTHPMYAKATYQGPDTPVNFSFQYLTAALKLTLDLEGIPADVTLASLQLSGVKLYESVPFNLTTEGGATQTGFPTPMGKVDNPSLTTDGIFYTALIPNELPEGMTIVATGSDGKTYIATLPPTTIEAGNIYVATASLAEYQSNTPITTATMLNVAIGLATGTENDPTEITLSGDMGANAPIGIGSVGATAKHISIDGGGKTITLGTGTQNIFVMGNITSYPECSLALKNITLDGNNIPNSNYLVFATGSKITIGAETTIQNMKNLEMGGFTWVGAAIALSSGDINSKPATLVMNDGSINVDGYAITCLTARCAVTFNGGTIHGGVADMSVPSATEAQYATIDFKKLPKDTGEKLTLSVNIGSVSYTDVFIAKLSDADLTVDNFELNELSWGSAAEDVTDWELYVEKTGEESYLKVRAKSNNPTP